MGRCTWEGFIRSVKLFLTYVFSHIGLCAGVAGYSVAGAFIFRMLEQKNIEVHYDSKQQLNETLEAIYNITEDTAEMVHPIQWRADVLLKLETFEENLKEAVSNGLHDQGPEAQREKWNFIGSLFYCVTVITTIGYGHISPKTWEGKIVTIVYAVFGIPLMLLCLTNIGDSMASAFRFTYRRMCCSGCMKKEGEPVPLLPVPSQTRSGSTATSQTNSSSAEPIPYTPPPKYKPSRRNMLISPPISATIHRGSDDPMVATSKSDKPLSSSKLSPSSSARGSSKHVQTHMTPAEIEVNQIIAECAAYTHTPIPGLRENSVSNCHDYDFVTTTSYSPRTPSPTPLIRTPSPPSPASTLFRDTSSSVWERENGSSQLTVPVVADGSASCNSTRPTSPSSVWPHHSSNLSLGSAGKPCTNPESSTSITWALPLEDEGPPIQASQSSRPTGKTLVVYNTLSGDALLQQSKIARKMDLMNKGGYGSIRKTPSTVFTDPVSGEAIDGDMLGLSYRPIATEPTDKDTRVPVMLVLAFVAGYLGVGALLFGWLEGWGFLDAGYFCFITLSTIGFGDFVPGRSLGYKTTIAQVKLVASSLYLLLGLAVLAMSFSLVQEEVVIKCKAFAQYIGLLKD